MIDQNAFSLAELGATRRERGAEVVKTPGSLGASLHGMRTPARESMREEVFNMPHWRNQGQHRFYRDGDLVYVEVHGPFDVADARRIYEEGDAIEREYGYALSIFDNRDGPGMTAEARRYTNQKGRERVRSSATAILGASLAVRTMVILLMNALRLAGKPIAPIFFCSSEEEAMTWLASQRQQLREVAKSLP